MTTPHRIRWIAALALMLALVAWWPTAGQQPPAERDPEFDAAKAALDDGFYTTAARRFEAYVNKTASIRKKAHAAIYLFNAWYGQREYKKITDWLDDNWPTVMKGSKYDGAATYWYARAKYALGDYEATIQYLREFVVNFPGDEFAPYALRLRAEAFIASGQYETGEQLIARYDLDYAARADIPDNLMDWAEVLLRLKRRPEARAKLERLLRDYPAHPEVHRARLWMGQWDLEDGAFPAATNMLYRVAADSNAPAALRADAWFALARASMDRDVPAAALNALQQGEALVTNESRRVDARIDQARVLMGMNRLVDAVEIMNQTVLSQAATPQAARVQLELADLLRAQKRHELAAESYQRYIESFSDAAGVRHALYSKAWCLWELGRYAEAATAFEKAYGALRNQALRAQALIKAADAYFQNGQFRSAATAYERVVEEFPDNEQRATALYQAGESYARATDATNAVRLLRRLADDDQADPALARNGLMRLARFLEEQHDWEEAVQIYDHVLARFAGDPALPEVLSARAQLKFKLGRYGDARRDFGLVYTNYPDTPWREQAFYMQARCAYQLGETTAALKAGAAFPSLFTNSPLIPDVAFWMAEHDYNTQQYAAAETNFAAIALLVPSNQLAATARYWAGRAAMEQKAFKRALDEHLNPMVRLYPHSPLIPEARFSQGDALTEIGDFAGAILAFNEITLRHPTHPLVVRALGRMGDCQFTLGSERPERYPEAVETFRQVLAHPDVTRDLAIQAEYKMARAFERIGRTEDAVSHYLNVVYDWLAARQEGILIDEVWFVRSAFSAAALKETAGQWDDAVAIYKRVVASGVTAASDANIRIDRLAIQRQKAGTKTTVDQPAPR